MSSTISSRISGTAHPDLFESLVITSSLGFLLRPRGACGGGGEGAADFTSFV